MSFEQSAGHTFLEATSAWPEILSEATVAADPGLAAAVSGGAVLSQPLQWFLVTMGGLVCAAFSQQAFLPGPGSSPSAAAVECGDSEEERKSLAASEVPTDLKAAPAKSSPASHQASLANWEVKEATLQSGPRVQSALPPRANAVGVEKPAQLEASPIKPTRLQTSAELKNSELSAKNAAKPCVPTPCQETSRGRWFRRSGR